MTNEAGNHGDKETLGALRWVRAAQLGVVALGVIVGCSGEAGDSSPGAATTGPLMRPGDNCLRCHNDTGTVGAPTWSAAGTLFPSFAADPSEGVADAVIRIADRDGTVVELTTNEAGNFYTAEPLLPPLHVTLIQGDRTLEMPVPAPAGSCNACHSLPSVGGAQGRIAIVEAAADASRAQCDGEHTLTVSGVAYDCAPYACTSAPSAQCRFSCATDAECVDGARCQDTRCVP